MKAKDLFSVAKESFQEWSEDRAPNEAAALAYYTMLSVPALLLLIQWVLGQVVSEQVQEQVINFVAQSIRGQGSEAIRTMIESADQQDGGAIATIISLATLAISATGVVVQLEQALNRMWEIEEEDAGIVDKIRERLSSLLLVLGLGVFLLISVTVSTVVTGFAETLADFLPFGTWVIQVVNIAFTLLLLTGLFGAVYKIIPDAIVEWSDVWLGAAITAVLFVVGQYALSIYLGRSAPGSAYGAAGSIVAFVVWVYYSALIMFLGAEFTQVYANRFGSHIKPDETAIPLEEKVRREQSHPSVEPESDQDAAAGAMTAQATAGQRSSPSEAQPQPGVAYPGGSYQAQQQHTVQSAGAESRPYPSRMPPAYSAERREETNSFQYYTIAILAVALGVWRWIKGSS
jgi:membrane protein